MRRTRVENMLSGISQLNSPEMSGGADCVPRLKTDVLVNKSNRVQTNDADDLRMDY